MHVHAVDLASESEGIEQRRELLERQTFERGRRHGTSRSDINQDTPRGVGRGGRLLRQLMRRGPRTVDVLTTIVLWTARINVNIHLSAPGIRCALPLPA